MDIIKRINFSKTIKDLLDFEIVDLDKFFRTRPMEHLSRVYRLNFYIMIYVTSGEGKHEIDFKVYDYKEGDVVFIAKNQVHRFLPDTKADGYIILFKENFLYSHSEYNIQDFLNHFNMPLYNPVISISMRRDQTNRNLIDLLFKEYQNDDHSVKTQLIKSLFRSFMLSLQRLTHSDESLESSLVYKRYVEFKNLVEKYYKEKKTVQEYANLMLVSSKTINQTTRMVVDLSAKQFIIDRLLLEIKRYLGQGELTINEISDLMGFDEPSNLTKFFKRYEGISPNKFKIEYDKN